MKSPVQSVKPLDSIQHARELMERHRVNQLPVIVDGKLVGIITDRDLRDAFPSVFDSSVERKRPKVTTTDPRTVSVEMVMTAEATTVRVGASMADAARLMRKMRIGALPVVDGGRVVGMLTRSDILEAFTDLVAIEEERETGAFAESPAPPSQSGAKDPRRRSP
ncbi:MAG TPA: CBS domain-containing protein [Candidatus Dormibacteraeota bacterium]|nr:CBS domain-containing protein [Candidatus Dormibacteraeota bacterium]